MILNIVGADIEQITLSLINDDHQEMVAQQTIPGKPETYLAIIDTFLTANKLSLVDVTGILVPKVEGSSATAMRVSHAIANSWAFARGIPLYRTLDGQPVSILLPEYEEVAHITVRKKDALYRKT